MTTANAHFLSNLDSIFLVAERETTPMHSGATLLFEPAPLAPGNRLDLDTIEAFLASRAGQIPRYRQRLAWIPLEGRPVRQTRGLGRCVIRLITRPCLPHPVLRRSPQP
jgi:Wax ester synthase/diacylglycerol acyltransferase catalytic domain